MQFLAVVESLRAFKEFGNLWYLGIERGTTARRYILTNLRVSYFRGDGGFGNGVKNQNLFFVHEKVFQLIDVIESHENMDEIQIGFNLVLDCFEYYPFFFIDVFFFIILRNE